MSVRHRPQWEDCQVCGGDHWTKDHPDLRLPPEKQGPMPPDRRPTMTEPRLAHNHPPDHICLTITCPRGAWSESRNATLDEVVRVVEMMSNEEWRACNGACHDATLAAVLDAVKALQSPERDQG